MKDKEELSITELKKAATIAFKECMDSLAKEPSIIVIGGNAVTETDTPSDEILDWLFRRRQDGSNTGN